MSAVSAPLMRLHRRQFETAGLRSIEVAAGSVTWPDGRVSRFNVRIMAQPGSNGALHLVAEDVNREVAVRVALFPERAGGGR